MKSRMNDLSNKHFHWCVDKTWDLASEVTLQSVQALILLAAHSRCFPKPGPAWLITTLAWTRAIEMNLHRNNQKSDEPTNLDNEMRKRAWWCLFMIVVIMYGRLGKPMPIRGEDIDVEFPVVIPDEYLTEDGIAEPGQIGDCDWAVASGCFRLAFLFMEMYNKVYVVRSDARSHIEAVRSMEQKFRAFERELPDELKLDKCKPGNRIMATYLEASKYEFQLCLRHPSRCTTNDPAFVAESYRICEDASRRLLQSATELARLKSLDTTWYQLAVYVAAVFTLLAARWVRRAEVTPAELTALKEEMNMGLQIISEVLKYIGMLPLVCRSRHPILSPVLFRRHRIGIDSTRRINRIPSNVPNQSRGRPYSREYRTRHDDAAGYIDITLPPAPATPNPTHQARRIRTSQPTGPLPTIRDRYTHTGLGEGSHVSTQG